MSRLPTRGASPAQLGAYEPVSSPVRGLPAQLTSLVGREREIEAVRRLLAGVRLLTLTGAGGSGKTRLAVEVLAREGASGHSGAWVELATVHDPSLVPAAVLAALGVHDQGAGEGVSAARLAAVVGDRPFLLALDNCEHLVDACAALAAELLHRCRALRVIATSREVLGVTGETAWLVPPMSLPGADLSAMEGSEAVQLFVERARGVNPVFTLGDPAQRRAVVEICRRLDGLPLALELAAARLRALTPEQIAARLDDRFRLLTTGSRTALPRHQTLRAAIDWSHDLLDERGRRLLARLAVFDGGFTLEAAEQVCGGDGVPAADVLDGVSELVDRSLVQMNEAGDSARYRLLETVRQYAAERLAAAGELPAVRRRHAEFYAALVAAAEPHLTTALRPLWIRRLEAELDNLRQTLEWSRTHDEPMHVRVVGMLLWFWFAIGHWPEARHWLASALETDAGRQPTRDRAAVLFAIGAIAALQARVEAALEPLEEAERLAAAHDDARLLAYVRNYRAMALSQAAPERAAEPLRLARAWAREAGDLYALRLSHLLEASTLIVLGHAAGAVAAAEEGVRIARVWGLERELAMSLQVLGQIVMRLGDLARARALFRESLDCMRRDPQPLFLARGLEVVASCLVREGAALEATRVLGAASAYRQAIGAERWKIDADQYAPTVAAARAALGDEAYEAAYAQGRTLGTEAAIALALETADRRATDERPEPTKDTGEYRIVRAAEARGLRVRTFGRLVVTIGDAEPPRAAWRYAKMRELLAVLAIWPQGRTREQIGALLWPEASSAQVRNSFHVALHHLRRALGAAEWVAFDRERYRLDVPGGVEVDALLFEERAVAALRDVRRGAASAESLGEVSSLYRGPFLDGEPVGDWHLELRDRLARLHADVLEALGGVLLERGRWDEADAAFERLVEAEPLHEAAYRGVMRARAALGDAAGVVRAYRQLEAVLRRELEVEPEPATTALLRELQRK